ncbi:hypothetical protein [uncultured Roseovarius sp.]|uniref:hypothetical protein n=1 Tax=uncultured Roseovarius sp. TaxID=293344 RepID=UPI0025989228|nr:hypothetical protein [uncultured Roseovarius sp.]
MSSDEIRQQALQMLETTIPHSSAIMFTFMVIMAMIEREGFKIPSPEDAEAFLLGNLQLIRAK